MPRQTVKQMLIELYREEREQMRCTLVHELKQKVEVIAKPFEIEMEEVQRRINSLEGEISALRKEKYIYKEKMDKEIRKARLQTFSHKTCGDALHPRLTEFDQVTNNHIRGILESTGKE